MGLVITRKTGESIIIDDEIEVNVVRVKGGSSVRLHFICPKETVIDRKEDHEKNRIRRDKGLIRRGG
jgi:carbon storage regulator CsrA